MVRLFDALADNADASAVVLSFLDVRDVSAFGRACRRCRVAAARARHVACARPLAPDAAAAMLARFPCARALFLSDCSSLGEDALASIVRRLRSVSGLQLSRVRLSTPSVLQAVAANAAHMRGGVLRLEGAIMLPRAALDALTALADLSELHLCGAVELCDAQLRTLLARSARSLRSLSVDDCAALTSVALSSCGALVEFSCARCPRLATLAADAPRLAGLRAPGCRALRPEALHGCAHLARLDISRCTSLAGELVLVEPAPQPPARDAAPPPRGCLRAEGATGIARLVLRRDDVAHLALGGCLRLQEVVLQLAGSPLTELDLSCLPALEVARVSGLLLRALDASWCARLRTLRAREGCPRLRSVRVVGTPLEAGGRGVLEVPDGCLMKL